MVYDGERTDGACLGGGNHAKESGQGNCSSRPAHVISFTYLAGFMTNPDI
jgi:hypothetical protein